MSESLESTAKVVTERGLPSIEPRPGHATWMRRAATLMIAATVLGVGLWWTARRIAPLFSAGHAADAAAAHERPSWIHRFEQASASLSGASRSDASVSQSGAIAPPFPDAFDPQAPPGESLALLKARMQALAANEHDATGLPVGAMPTSLMVGAGASGAGARGAASKSPAALLIVGAAGAGAESAVDSEPRHSDADHPAYPVAEASELSDRSNLLAAGSIIDCVLQSRLDSTLPGMTTCLVTRPVYSDDGRATLIARGSLVTGEYRSSAVLGQDRLYVLWKRLKTPDGAVINLESPATDPLGAAGVKGQIDEHWRDRIGAALLLSIVQDTLAYATSAQQSGSGGTTVVLPNTTQTGNTMASKVLESTIGIAPTLTKQQGERVSILVARDLRFDLVAGVSGVTSSR